MFALKLIGPRKSPAFNIIFVEHVEQTKEILESDFNWNRGSVST